MPRQDPGGASAQLDSADLRRPRAGLERRLRWLIAIRLVVITSFVFPYLLSQLASPTELPTFDFLFLIAGFTYVVSLVYIALLRILRGRLVQQAFIQFSGDLIVVTGLVYYFGGIGSPFSLFYLVVIMVASTMLRRRSGLLVATAAFVLYASLIIGLAYHYVPPAGPSLSAAEIAWRLPYNLGIHLFGFYAVAFLTSIIAENMRRAEEELAEKRDSLANLEAFHHDVVQSISTGLVTSDLGGRITSLNRAAIEILRRGDDELLGEPLTRIGLFSTEEWTQLAAHATEMGRTLRTEAEIDCGGEIVPIGFNLSSLTDASGVPTGHILLFQDLSQWRQLEQELRLKDRMAAVGELAAGLAHEVGNPLAAISGSVQLLSQSPDSDSSQHKLLEIILRESQRLDRTIKGFLRFARPRERATAAFDIAALLRENTELLRNSDEATLRHRFSLDLEPPTAQLVGDRDQISQIFWNLARNALRAMPEGGDAPDPRSPGGRRVQGRVSRHRTRHDRRAARATLPAVSLLLRFRNRHRHGDRLPHRPGTRRSARRREWPGKRHPDRGRATVGKTGRRGGGSLIHGRRARPHRRRREEPGRIPLGALRRRGI